MFIRRIEGSGYDFIHFDAVENTSSTMLRGLLKTFAPKRVRGYNSTENNPFGLCAYLTWMEFYDAFTNIKKNPFNFRSTRLIEYNKKLRKFFVPKTTS